MSKADVSRLLEDPDVFIPECDFVGKESDIELHLLDNIITISKKCGWGEIRKVERQYRLKFGFGQIVIDILIQHTDGTATAIEVKSSKTNRNNHLMAIGQIMSYGSLLKKIRGNFPRLVIASNEINPEVYNVVKDFNIPICFLMADGDRFIYLS